MGSMTDYTSQPLTRAAIQAQAEAIAARQAADAGLPVPTVEETVVEPTPLVVAPPVVVPPIVVPVVKTVPVEEPAVEPVVVEEPAPSIAEVEKSIANVELDEERQRNNKNRLPLEPSTKSISDRVEGRVRTRCRQP